MISRARRSCASLRNENRNTTAIASRAGRRPARRRRRRRRPRRAPAAPRRSSRRARRPRGGTRPGARNVGVSGVERQVVHLVAHLAADLEHVAEALGGDQADAGALALQHGVGRDRRAMHEAGDLLRRQAPVAPPCVASACSTAMLGSLRVLGIFMIRIGAPAPRTTTSVNVPPISTPTRRSPRVLIRPPTRLRPRAGWAIAASRRRRAVPLEHGSHHDIGEGGTTASSVAVETAPYSLATARNRSIVAGRFAGRHLAALWCTRLAGGPSALSAPRQWAGRKHMTGANEACRCA